GASLPQAFHSCNTVHSCHDWFGGFGLRRCGLLHTAAKLSYGCEGRLYNKRCGNRYHHGVYYGVHLSDAHHRLVSSASVPWSEKVVPRSKAGQPGSEAAVPRVAEKLPAREQIAHGVPLVLELAACKKDSRCCRSRNASVPPAHVVESAATRLPYPRQSSRLARRRNLWRKPALKLSPAPTVSTG